MDSPKTLAFPEPPARAEDPPLIPIPDDIDARLAEWEVDPCWTARAGRRTMREKTAAGIRGLKQAFRGDSSFFAHTYRTLLIALAAALLGIGPMQWCVFVLSASLVLIAELAHSAIDTLARSLGDPEAPGPKVAREIATGGVLVAVVVFAATSIIVLSFKLNDMFGWW